MAKKFGEPGENLVQGAGRFGGSTGSGNVPSGGTSRMSRLDYADSLEKAKKLSKQADKEMLAKEKAVGVKREPQTRDTEADKSVASRTNPDNMSSGSYMKGRAYMQDEFDYGMKKGGSVSAASKRADGCAIRGRTRA